METDSGDAVHVEDDADPADVVGRLDWAIVSVYLVLSVCVGLFCGRKAQGGDSDEYLLAGKSMNGFIVAISTLGGSYSPAGRQYVILTPPYIFH